MTETRPFHDPRRLFELWEELTGEDLFPSGSREASREKKKEAQT
jgi:hypothetical protein